MGVLDQIEKMKKEGENDKDIADKLQEQGVNPKAINDAFNQMKIKNAVSAEDDNSEESYNNMNGIPTPSSGDKFYTPRTQEMNPPQDYSNYNDPNSTPYPQQDSQQQSQQEYYPSEGYSDAGYTTGGYASGGIDTETMIEVAQQVFEEKTKKIQKQLSELSEFANLAETKISNNHDRLKRIEAVLDKLQITILEKVGSYAQDIGSVKKEMSMMQDTFSKTLPELAEHHRKKAHEHKK